ncbi:MAG: hypothetical protein OEM22_00425 [Acidimicrobiia bacterium]|nr:hypothetical protein [Acidimicrobiia bacterium]
MHPSRVVIVLGAIVGTAALSLPVVEFSARGSVNGIEGDLWPAMALIGFPTLIAVFGDRAEGFTKLSALAAITASSGALVFTAFKIADAVKATNDTAATLGLGGWVVGGVCLVVLVASVSALTKRLA